MKYTVPRCIGWVILMAVAILRFYPTPSFSQAPEIRPGTPVMGNISEDTPTQLWQLNASTGQQLTILVNRQSGDLDPQLRVLDTADEVVAENDDRLTALVLDSGLEVEFAEAGSYIIEVGRRSGSGDYRLWLVPGYIRVWEDEDFEENASRWVDRNSQQQNGQLHISGEIEFAIFSTMRGRIPLNDFYVQADFTWQSDMTDSGATTGLVLRVNEDGTRRPPGYYFLVTPDGTWQVLIRQNDQFIELQTSTASELLSGNRVTLGAWLEGETLRFYANGELLGEFDDSTFTQGTWGFQVRGDDAPAQVAVDHILLTVPETQILRTPESLSTWRSPQPSEIAGELERVRLVGAGGERALTVESQNYEIIPRFTRIFPQGDADDIFVDMLVSVDVRVLAGQNVGCGLALRSIDEGNQVVAYADSDGGTGLIYARDGMVERHTYDLLPEVEDPISANTTRLLILLRGDVVMMYVNGQLFTTEFMPPAAGQVAVILLNYATDNPSCLFEDLWVWRWP